MTTTTPQRRGIMNRIGFPGELTAGLIGVMVFLVGDGIESTWLTNYLHTTQGYSVGQAGLLLTFYGIVVAIGAFLSGALSSAIGPRRVMMLGAATFVVFDLLFILVGLSSHDFALLSIVYALRGLGYPLFAYGFLTWVMRRSTSAHQSSAAGWFWFAFSVGLQILGSYISSFFLPSAGAIGTLWVGFALAVIGALMALLFIRADDHEQGTTERKPVAASLVDGFSIIWRRPKVGLGGLVKVINLAGPSALLVFYVPYLVGVIHMDETHAILEFTFFGIFAVLGNLFWGYMGDLIGWRNSMQWFGTVLCGVAFLYLYFVPQIVGPNFWVICFGTLIIGAGVSAFVPLTPLMIAFAPSESGAALSIVNLGAGLAAFVGPAIAAILIGPIGYGGVMITIAALYAVAFIIMLFLRLPGNTRTAPAIAELVIAPEANLGVQPEAEAPTGAQA